MLILDFISGKIINHPPYYPCNDCRSVLMATFAFLTLTYGTSLSFLISFAGRISNLIFSQKRAFGFIFFLKCLLSSSLIHALLFPSFKKKKTLFSLNLISMFCLKSMREWFKTTQRSSLPIPEQWELQTSL